MSLNYLVYKLKEEKVECFEMDVKSVVVVVVVVRMPAKKNKNKNKKKWKKNKKKFEGGRSKKNNESKSIKWSDMSRKEKE